MITTEQFFADTHRGLYINFRCIRNGIGKPIDTNGLYNETLRTILHQANEQSYEVYFVVNHGGYRDEQITSYNAVFIDLDCGKDEKGNYLPLDVVDDYKNNKLTEIEDFSLKPSYIIETRNGLHVYWLLHEGADREQFTACEERLIALFDADRKVKNPARLMRVPGFYWMKDPDNKFMTTIIQQNGVRYDIHNILDSLPIVEDDGNDVEGQGFRHRNKKESINTDIIAGRKTLPPNPNQSDNSFQGLGNSGKKHSNIALINDRRADELRDSLNVEPITLSSHDEVYEYLKKQNLGELLGVGLGNHRCLFHYDTSPSASVYINRETGHYLYKCHSNKCGVFGSIIQIIGRMTNLDRYSTLRFLRNIYRIEYAESEWQKEQRAILDENMQFLLAHGDMKMFYSAIYERIKDYLPQLYALHGYAKDKVQTESFTSVDGEPIFFASNRHLADLFGKDGSTTSERLALMTYLGLIKKWSEDKVPEFLIRKARHEAASKKHKYTINFFSIPAYSEQIFSFAISKAKEYKEKGFTMKGFSRELLLRALGEVEANRVYPRLEGQQISEFSEELCKRLEELAYWLIGEKGWTYEKEIIMMFEDNNVKRSLVELQIKRILPEMLDKYDLRKVRLNKRLKEQLDILINGYPFIILQNCLYEEAMNTKKESKQDAPIEKIS